MTLRLYSMDEEKLTEVVELVQQRRPRFTREGIEHFCLSSDLYRDDWQPWLTNASAQQLADWIVDSVREDRFWMIETEVPWSPDSLPEAKRCRIEHDRLTTIIALAQRKTPTSAATTIAKKLLFAPYHRDYQQRWLERSSVVAVSPFVSPFTFQFVATLGRWLGYDAPGLDDDGESFFVKYGLTVGTILAGPLVFGAASYAVLSALSPIVGWSPAQVQGSSTVIAVLFLTPFGMAVWGTILEAIGRRLGRRG